MIKINWFVVALTVLVPILIIVIVCFYRISKVPKLIPQFVISSTKCDLLLETGDLVFVRYTSKYATLIKIFTQTDWAHVGMVYKKNNQIFIIELADYSKKYTGLCIVPFDEWLEINDGKICAYRSLVNLERPKWQQIEGLIKKYKDIELNMNLFYWYSTLTKQPYVKLDEKVEPLVCSEFIAILLQELGLLEKKWLPKCYIPSILYTIPNYTKSQIFFIDIN